MDNRKSQYGHQNRKYLYLQKYNRYCQNSKGKSKVFDEGKLEESVPLSMDDSNNERQLEMINETGNIYISETMRDAIKIPTASSVFMTVDSLKKCHQVTATMTNNQK